MFKLMLIFVLGSIVGYNCVSNDRRRELDKLGANYGEINDHLIDNVKDGDIAANMREAKRWLDEEVSTSSNENLKTALKLFTSMENMHDCTTESVDILDENDYATGSKPQLIKDGLIEISTSTIVAEIIAHYAIKHATKCLPKYIENLREKYDKVGKSTTERVHYIVNKVQYEADDDVGVVAYAAVKDLAKDDPDKQYLGKIPNRRAGYRTLDETKLRELYDKYLVGPCKQFIDLNSDNWYYLFSHDIKWADVEESEDAILTFEKRSRICRYLFVDNYEKFYELFKKEAEQHNA